MSKGLLAFFKTTLESLRDLAPVVGVVLVFQFALLRQPLPDALNLMVGLVLVVLGLTFFVFGLQQGLFPIGESMAQEFARKGSAAWLLLFAFALGFGTTVAEPALIACCTDHGVARLELTADR